MNNHQLLDALLDSWDRGNTVLVNLLRAIPKEKLAAKAMESSPTVSQMFMHMHHERMISVSEEAPEIRVSVPKEEWAHEQDPERIAAMLNESAKAVRDAVRGRVEAGKKLELNFAHAAQLVPFLIFHEGYHHGQIKLALKIAGCPISNEIAGPMSWDIWRAGERNSR